MGETLKPCPFCGGSTIIVMKTMYGYGHTVSCDDCTAMVASAAEPPIDSERDAVSIWNTRAKPILKRIERQPIQVEAEANE